VRSRFTRVRGLRVHWREGGSGEPIVLVHGIGVSGRYLLPTARLLEPTHRVLVPDLPGFGPSAKPSRALGVRGLARALAAWLDAIGVESAPLVANSIGCQIVVALAREHTERAERLVLVGPTVDAHARSFPRQAFRLALDTAREPPSLAAIVALDYLTYGPLRFLATARSALNDRIEDHARFVAAPVLVVRGARDALVSQRFAEELAARFANGRLVVVPDSPHAVNYARPDVLARLVRDFLSERSAAASD